jgi:hypothetical protein
MALADLVLKAKVNMALLRDPRVGVLEIGVLVEEGNVTLLGDVDEETECHAAEEIARGIMGVASVHCKLTSGVGKAEDTAERLMQRLLDKLDKAWEALPDQSALTQADYLSWSLWLIYKFRLPTPKPGTTSVDLETTVTETALGRVASHLGIPKVLVALEMLRQAEAIEQSPTRTMPETGKASLATSPQTS